MSTSSITGKNIFTLFYNHMANRAPIYKNLISPYKDEDSFNRRYSQLERLTSYHVFPAKQYVYADSQIKTNQSKSTFNFQQLIEQRIEMNPYDIKNMIWQITKCMLNCEEFQLSHLRLCPQALVLAGAYKQRQPIFVKVKDFSFGKEFESAKQGKVQQIFEYLHPSLSIENGPIDLSKHQPQLDIWSLGIILYKMIYFQSPFCKQGKDTFSKAILIQYQKGKHNINYDKPDFDDINRFIKLCLSIDKNEKAFRNWREIKRYIIQEEEVYNYLDFHDEKFESMAKIHIKSMIFFSNIYCMIIDQCKFSLDKFWKTSISKQLKIPFVLKVCEFTLTLMKMLQDRFYRLYQGHLFLITPKTRNQLIKIAQNLRNQLAFMQNKWIQQQLNPNNQQLNLRIINLIRQICIKVKMQASLQKDHVGHANRQIEVFDSKRITQRRSYISKKKNSTDLKRSQKEIKVWRNVQIILDYCDEILIILSTTDKRQKFKLIYEEIYINSDFDVILAEQFHFSQDNSELFKKIYKQFLQ